MIGLVKTNNVHQTGPGTYTRKRKEGAMPVEATYNSQPVPWDALKELAHRAATTTPLKPAQFLGYQDPGSGRVVDVIGPHWVLQTRFENFEKKTATRLEEEHTDAVYALQENGELVVASVRKGGEYSNPIGSWGRPDASHSIRKMTDRDVESFDFAERYYEKHFDEVHRWGTVDDGYGVHEDRGELQHQTKGAGLSAVLQDLISGQASKLPGAIPLHRRPSSPASNSVERSVVAPMSASAEAQALDWLAIMLVGGLAITVVLPYLLGHYVMAKTFVLRPDPGVYVASIRGFWDHFWPTYLAGLLPIIVVLGVFLVVRRPWTDRMSSVVIGWAALIGSLVLLLPYTTSQWRDAEADSAAKLRETAFPFATRFLQCASWTINAENGVQQPELWQVHLGQLLGTSGTGCNQVNIYRGWQFVTNHNLPTGDFFTGDIVVNYQGWPDPYKNSGGGSISSQSSASGLRLPMNPNATSIDLGTTNGHRLLFTLAGEGPFDLR